jgi:hypothetical protein
LIVTHESKQRSKKTEPQPADRPRSTNPSMLDAPLGEEPQGVQHDVAEADKKARSGKKHEQVRNTPPAGAWNDTTHD